MASKGLSPPSPKLAAVATKLKPVNIQKLQAAEKHKEKFEDDAEKRKEARGYMIVFFCNALSCVSLFFYVAGIIDPGQELQFELAFLIFKGIVEIMTGKFSWELLLHHTAMMVGFLFNQHPSMRCWAFITVHQQFVHIPFAIRALWRLTLPAFGYVRTEFSWRRRFLINFFWISWMFTVGYRAPMIVGYCVNGFVNLGMTWQPAIGLVMAAILGNLDRAWTRAMWPRPGATAGPSNRKSHEIWFHVGTRLMFCAGLTYAVLAVVSDVAPDRLPAAVRIPFAPHFSKGVLECLAECPGLLCKAGTPRHK